MSDPEPLTTPDGKVLGYNCPECGTTVKTETKAAAHCTDDDTRADGGTDTDAAAASPSDDEDADLDPYRVSPEGIDDDMKRCQWVNWQIEGSKGKTPKRPSAPTRYARSNEAMTWGSFADALSNAEGNDLGIGFPFEQGTPFVALDIDIPGGGDWVPDLDRLGDAVIERSPSGNFRVYLRDVTVPDWWTDQSADGKGTREVGIYDDSQYVTVTGDTLDGHETPIGDTSDAAFKRWLKEAWRAFNDGDEETPPWEDTGSSGGPTSASPSRGSSGENTTPAGDTDVDIGIYDIIGRSQHPTGERVGHPFHGSDTGTNFLVDDDGETFRCWRHDVTGHAGHLLAMDVGAATCGDWDSGGLSASWADIYDAAREQGYDIPPQDHRKSDGTLPDDTPEPPCYELLDDDTDLVLRLLPRGGREVLVAVEAGGVREYSTVESRGFWESSGKRAHTAGEIVSGVDAENIDDDDLREAMKSALTDIAIDADREPDAFARALRSQNEQELRERTENVVCYPSQAGTTWIITMAAPSATDEPPRQLTFDEGDFQNESPGMFETMHLGTFQTRIEIDSAEWRHLADHWLDIHEKREWEADPRELAAIEKFVSKVQKMEVWEDEDGFGWDSRNGLLVEEWSDSRDAVLLPGRWVADWKQENDYTDLNLSRLLRENGIMLAAAKKETIAGAQNSVWPIAADELGITYGKQVADAGDADDEGDEREKPGRVL